MGARPGFRRHRGISRPILSTFVLCTALASSLFAERETYAGGAKTPSARIIVTQVAIPALTARADASGSSGRGTTITSYTFSFGDGTPTVVQPASNAIASHAYAASGTYTVSVTALNNFNLTATASQSITVQPENAPVARLSVSQLASPWFTVSANGSTSTDGDLTPIASYKFNFGDGTGDVTQATSSAQHTYAGQGTYTVTLLCTDTGGNASSTASFPINVVPPPENPPGARLALTSFGTMGVNADGSTSTDTDLTPIASYKFDFGDGTGDVTQTSATAQHTYANAGTYTVSLVATDTGNNASSAASGSITVGSAPPPPGGVAVYAGYYDTHHTDYPKPKPSPWRGAANVTFVGTTDPGTTNGWDTSALRIDNLTGAPLSGVNATVDMATHHFALWTAQTIPTGGTLILAQTGLENFDGSDTSPAGCYSCNPNDCLTKVSSAIPVVHLTIGTTTTNYYDPTQVLNTKGVDGAGCPYTGTRNDESHAWAQLGTTAPAIAQSSGADSRGLELPAETELWMAPPFPNPAGRNVTIRFGMPAAGTVRLGVYDVAGRLVRRSIDGELSSGSYVDVLDVSGLEPGAYFVRLITPTRTVHQAFMIAR